MTGYIYDHLLIVGTVCSLIPGMTNAWLLYNWLIPTLSEILQKSSRKNYASAGILGRELLASRRVFRDQGRGILRPLSEIRKYETKQNRMRKLRIDSSK